MRVAEKVLPLDERETTAMAALLHDIGHGPFSHVLDGVMRELGQDGIHEQISRAIIRTRFGDHLDADEAGTVCDLIDPPKGQRSAAQDIVSGPADADKYDYLMRDSHYCGVAYGRFDLERIIETAELLDSAGQTQLAFQEGGLYAVEGLLLARRSMHRQVYRQKTRRATDVMLIRAIKLAIDSGDDIVARLIPSRDDDDNPVLDERFVDGYLDLDDESLRRHLEKNTTGPSQELAQSLRRRELVHEVVQLDDGLIRHLRSGLWLGRLVDPTIMTRERVAEVEQSIADDLGCEPHWVFLTIESDKNPLYSPPGWDPSPGDIIIVREHQQNEKFQELSDVWSESGSSPSYTYVSFFSKRHELGIENFGEWNKQEWATYVVAKLDEVIPN